MRIAFKKALKIFRYLAILFSITFWIYIVIDDFGLVEKYCADRWLEAIGNWTVYYLIYFLAFTFYFWLAGSAIILIYHKLIKANQPVRKAGSNGYCEKL